MSILQSVFRPSAFCSTRLRCLHRTYVTSLPSEPQATDRKKPKASELAAGSGSTTPRSSCPPDTILTGVNYLKGQPPVVSLTDDAYPEWLWETLKAKVYEDDGPGGKKERVERRMANRQAIKDRNFMQTQ